MKKLYLAMLAAAFLFGAVYGFYPPLVKKRQTADALEELAAVVAGKDRAKIGEALKALLSDTAQIHLRVEMFSLTGQDMIRPVEQDFDKQAFITFADHILYSMADYEYTPELESFALSPDGKSANVSVVSKEWSDGNNYYGGLPVMMRFSSNTQCSGEVAISEQEVQLSKLDCTQHLRAVPKPGEAGKLQQNPEALRQFLR